MIHLFSCVIPSCRIKPMFIISSPTCLYYLPIFNSIFNKSNLRMSIGYLQPLVIFKSLSDSSPEATRHFFTESVVTTTHEQNIICSKSHLDSTTHEQTIICRQLFAGHVVGSRPMKRKKKMHRMITIFITRHCSTLWQYMYEKHGYLFSYGKLAHKRVYGLCAIYKHSKN